MAGPELLVLVRHGEPAVDPSTPPATWPLTDAGVAAARAVGERLRSLGLAVIVSSTEQKAIDTARAISDVVGATFHTAEGLHEHERPWFPDRTQLERYLTEFFASPAAHGPVEKRFTRSLDDIVRAHRGQRLAVVTHGTVMSLHLAARYGLDGWKTWNALQMPSYAVVELRTKTLVDLVVDV